MTQRERDRLVVLKKAEKQLITQKQAAAELQLTERQVRRLLKRLKEQGDKTVVHALRGRASNRKVSPEVRQQALAVLTQPGWKGFGPTLASYHLAKDHQVRIGRETLRQMMIDAGLWRAQRQKLTDPHPWRVRRSCRGELVQWDTSEHDWLEGRGGGGKLYLIAMIDDATGELTARFAAHDSTAENMQLLWAYLERQGRPVTFYTDRASLFQSTPKVARNPAALLGAEREPLPPTQIGRALRELQIAWMPAHSPQAKGRIERAFATAQDRLVKGLRLAEVATLEEANRYLEQQFLPWWNQMLTVVPASPADAHRPLGPEHDLASSLSHVDHRQVTADYTFRHSGKMYQIARTQVKAGLRGGTVRIEKRLDGSLRVRFRQHWLEVSECVLPTKRASRAARATPAPRPTVPTAERTAAWRASGQKLFQGGLPVPLAASINRTRTPDTFD